MSRKQIFRELKLSSHRVEQRKARYTDLSGDYHVGVVAAGPPGRIHHGVLSTWREAAGRMKNPDWEEPGKSHIMSINLRRLPGGRGLSPSSDGSGCLLQPA